MEESTSQNEEGLHVTGAGLSHSEAVITEGDQRGEDGSGSGMRVGGGGTNA